MIRAERVDTVDASELDADDRTGGRKMIMPAGGQDG